MSKIKKQMTKLISKNLLCKTFYIDKLEKEIDEINKNKE